MKELSIAAQLRLEELEEVTHENIFEQCISKDDWEYITSDEGREEIARREWRDFQVAAIELNADGLGGDREEDTGSTEGSGNQPAE